MSAVNSYAKLAHVLLSRLLFLFNPFFPTLTSLYSALGGYYGGCEYCRERLEKEERKNQLVGQSNSRDSAIDNDFQDWDTETLDFEIVSDHTRLSSFVSIADSDI